MNVTISVPGTWHAFQQAEQLHRRDALAMIYTTYPYFKLDIDPPPKEKVHPIRHPELVLQIGTKFPSVESFLARITRWNSPTSRAKTRLFDRGVARRMTNVGDDGIFVGFAGASLRSLRRANELEMTTVLERCSSHIRTQARILRDEYDRRGNDRSPISEAHIEREETEYEVADYVIVPSEFVYDSFIEQGFSEDRLLTEPYAVDTDAFRMDQGQSGTGGPLRFLFAGGVGFRKGIPTLLDAWSKTQFPDAELLLAGRVEPELEPLLSRYDDKSIRVLGWVDDIGELYQASDIFIFPSLEEGSAYVTYEAMASGLPLITTKNSGWVGENERHGLVVPPNDSDSLVAAMQRLYENADERKQMGKWARDLISSEYTWDAYGERIYRRYQSILDRE